MSDNLTNNSVEIVKARLSLCSIIKSSVEIYYGIEAYLQAFFTTASNGDLPLSAKPERYIPH